MPNKVGQRLEKPQKEFEERVVQVDRVTYVVAGGKRLRFRVLVVVGNHKGKVGYGLGKATEVPVAVKKAVSQAKKHLINVPIFKGTIPHELNFKYGAAHIFLKPARVGTSIIAGGSVRTVLALAGIENVLSKILGSHNKINNVKATIKALSILRMPQTVENKLDKKEVSQETKVVKEKASKVSRTSETKIENHLI